MSLVITGASGQLGRLVTERVLERLAPDQVILVTRRPDAVADWRARGVSVRVADFDDPRSLPAGLAGGRRMLLISATDLSRRSNQHRAAIDAAVGARIEHVVYTSMLAPEPPNPAIIAPSHYSTERHLQESGVAWTVLRNSLYAEYQVVEAARAASGSFIHNRGTGRVAYVSRTDCAEAAAAVLTTAGHEEMVYEITGPAGLHASDLAALYCRLAGRTVEPIAVDDEAFRRAVLGADSLDDHARFGAELVTSLGRATRLGYLSACTDHVERLCGRAARPLEPILEAGLRSL